MKPHHLPSTHVPKDPRPLLLRTLFRTRDPWRIPVAVASALFIDGGAWALDARTSAPGGLLLGFLAAALVTGLGLLLRDKTGWRTDRAQRTERIAAALAAPLGLPFLIAVGFVL